MNRRLSMVYRFAPVQLIAVCVSQQGHGWFTESCTASSPLFNNLCFCSSAPRPLQPRWVCVTTLIVSFTTELITVCFIGSGGFINLCVLYCYCFILNIFQINVFSSVKTCDTVSVFSVLVIRESWFGSRILIIMMDLKQYDKVHHKTS